MITNKQALEKFNVTDAAIAAMKEEYLHLKINGIEDKSGYLIVKNARLTVKSKRIEVEKIRKELKEDSLRYGRIVDAEAKRITALLEPIEDHLSEEETRIDTEKENIRLEKERKQKELLQNRIDAFQKYEFVPNDMMSIALFSEEEFQQSLEKAKIIFEGKQKRLAEIEAEKNAEVERMKAESERLEKFAAEQRAVQEKLDADRKALEDEKRALEDEKRREEEAKKIEIKIEAARVEATEKARIETEERINREASEKAEKERLAKEEAQALEASRPDREKLIRLCLQLRKIQLPTLTTTNGNTILRSVSEKLNSIFYILESIESKPKRKVAA